MTNENGQKALDDQAINRSVIDRPDAPNSRSPVVSYGDSQIYWLISQVADEIQPWGRLYKQRDAQLRQFITSEPMFASSLGIICNRNAGFSWTLDGPPRTVTRMQEVLETANAGEGWEDLIIKASIDLYSQDNAAFIEIVRTADRETAPVIGLNHLDSARCTHTGNPSKPVIYQDRFGKMHLLDWYSVITLAEMPTPIEGFYGRQYCALSRLLRGVQIQNNYSTLDYEKSSGRMTREIHLVKGITTQQLNDAMAESRMMSDASGYTRFAHPVVTGTLDPKADVGHDTIELAGKPDSFDTKLNFDHYINLISMAFATDYQDFAPLPGGGLGTGAQSEMLHLKSRGKGPGRFMKLIAHAINFRVMPQNVKFLWDEMDVEAEKADAEVRALRAQTRRTRIESLEITPAVARQIANDEGDLAEEYIIMLAEEDLTPNTTIDDNSPAETQLTRPNVSTARTDKPAAPERVYPAREPAAVTPNPTARRPRQPQRTPG